MLSTVQNAPEPKLEWRSGLKTYRWTCDISVTEISALLVYVAKERAIYRAASGSWARQTL